jgi:DNA-binding SARP family transcriptional activator/pimeloyl-ACP methyl ester carboxylesterase
VLAMAPGRRLHREQVIDLLWPAATLAEATPRLHKATHFARRALGGDAIDASGDMVALWPGREVVVDVERFESAATRALDAGDDHDVDEALDRYGGELLPEDVYEEWANERRSAVRHLYLQLLRRAGRWSELLKEEPADEAAHVALMRAHLARGDRAAAIAQYDELALTLDRELGAVPGPDATDLRAAAEVSSPPPTSGSRTARRQEVRFCRAVDGSRLAYALSGEGPPLVKTPAWLSHLEHDWESPVWEHWMQALSERARLLRYDERGGGLSDWDTEEFDVAAWVADLLAVVDAAGVERFVLLCGSYVTGPEHPGGDERGRRLAALLAELAEVGWASSEPSFRQVFTSRFIPDGSQDLWREFNELQRLSTSPQNAARFLRAFATMDVAAVAPSVRCPTLVVHGRDDVLPGMEQGRAVAAMIPDSRFVSLPGRNHLMLAAEPTWSQFLVELDRFLAEVAASGDPPGRGAGGARVDRR